MGSTNAMTMRNFTDVTITLPLALDHDASNADVFMWKEVYKDKKAQKTSIENDIKKAYAIVWGQCTPTSIPKSRPRHYMQPPRLAKM